jgi:Archaeal transcriptional regulator TrmB
MECLRHAANRDSSTGKPIFGPVLLILSPSASLQPARNAQAPRSTMSALSVDNTLDARMKKERYATKNTLGSTNALFIMVISLIPFNKPMRIDLLLAALSLMLLASVQLFNEPQGTYRGTEIYALALELKEPGNQTIIAEGIYVKNGTQALVQGKLAGMGKGNLVIDTGERNLTIGGPLAGNEDVAASRIMVK